MKNAHSGEGDRSFRRMVTGSAVLRAQTVCDRPERQLGSPESLPEIAGTGPNLSVSDWVDIGFAARPANHAGSYLVGYGDSVVPGLMLRVSETGVKSWSVLYKVNRRFWQVCATSIDLEGLKRNRDQLWAEARRVRSPRRKHPPAAAD